ncbi:hypothetical protein Golomagni_00367 [Golovinomyces magnicellulatus]|nr:hypothetical protein Golomagni_00367 [Golovinomyces magnicellulatus]
MRSDMRSVSPPPQKLAHSARQPLACEQNQMNGQASGPSRDSNGLRLWVCHLSMQAWSSRPRVSAAACSGPPCTPGPSCSVVDLPEARGSGFTLVICKRQFRSQLHSLSPTPSRNPSRSTARTLTSNNSHFRCFTESSYTAFILPPSLYRHSANSVTPHLCLTYDDGEDLLRHKIDRGCNKITNNRST